MVTIERFKNYNISLIIMSATIGLISQKKGSNPGGKCFFSGEKKSFQAYFKYCFGSKISRQSSFVAEHQPIYEAITFELAKKLGLKTTDAYILLNPKKNVVFEGWKEIGEKDPSGRRYYFLSRWQEQPTAEELNGSSRKPPVLNHIVPIGHYPYLDSLLISDVIGRKQNYLIGADDKIVYLDLGCSFVHAHGGFIEQPNKMRSCNPKEIKKMSKQLNNQVIIDASNNRLVNLEELAESPYNMSLTVLNPWSQIIVRDLIDREELDEIYNHLVHSLFKTIPEFRKANLLIEG